MPLRFLSPSIALLLLGCQSPAAQSEVTPIAETPADTVTLEAPMWSLAGLAAQLRMAWLRQRVPPELGYVPGTTPWRRASLDLPPELSSPQTSDAASPGAVLTAVLRALGWEEALGQEVWEQTTRVWYEGDEAATAVVLRWGLQDDAIVGHDLQLRLRRGANGWYVEGLEERFHCGRGVSPDGLCL